MPKCIFSGADETTATFSEREHIFPKCIGGVRCLPLGYVSDEVNQSFSKMELGFARENPIVVTRRMFSPPMGRKKHTNREKIGIMRDTDHGTGYHLGIVRNCTPISLDQLVVTSKLPPEIPKGFPIHVILAPSMTLTHEQQAIQFWSRLSAYNGCPVCIKDANLPIHTYLLGERDKRWFLALHKSENTELIKPQLAKFVDAVSKMRPEQFFSENSVGVKLVQHHVETHFTFNFSLIDSLRVYAKIAINCLAELKGQDFAMSPALDEIKKAILTGEEIDKYVMPVKGPNPALLTLKQFSERLPLGGEPHCTTFVQDADGTLIAVVTLFGQDGLMIRMGRLIERFGADCYICDWEHRTDYTMEECAIKICGYDGEEWRDLLI